MFRLSPVPFPNSSISHNKKKKTLFIANFIIIDLSLIVSGLNQMKLIRFGNLLKWMVIGGRECRK